MSVKLSDMIEAMESQTDEDCTFINKETGEVVVIPQEFMRNAEEDTGEPVDELAKDVIDNEEKYLAPPDKFEIHEYKMMEDFCYSLEDQKKMDKLLSAIRGKGAFKRFKDMVMKIGVREAWFAYREDQYKEIAIAFCEENGLNYTE